MIGLGTLAKLAKGGLGVDEIGELFASMGISCTFARVPVASGSFEGLAGSAAAPGAEMLELSGKMATGQSLHALLVLGSKS